MELIKWERKEDKFYLYFQFHSERCEFLEVENGSFELRKNKNPHLLDTLIVKIPAVEGIYNFKYRVELKGKDKEDPFVPEIREGDIDLQDLPGGLKPLVSYNATWFIKWFCQ